MLEQVAEEAALGDREVGQLVNANRQRRAVLVEAEERERHVDPVLVHVRGDTTRDQLLLVLRDRSARDPHRREADQSVPGVGRTGNVVGVRQGIIGRQRAAHQVLHHHVRRRHVVLEPLLERVGGKASGVQAVQVEQVRR